MLRVESLMTARPYTVTLEMSLADVISIMENEGYRQLLVVDGRRLVGIVTDRDVRIMMDSPVAGNKDGNEERDLHRIAVENFMTPNPVTISPDSPAYRAAEILSAYKYGALPVVDDDELVGIITVTDFLNYFASSAKEAKKR